VLFDHPLFWLAIVTFLIVIAFTAWSLMSTRRRQKYGKRVEGIGGATIAWPSAR
jgi:hypothetical protein